MTRFRSLAALAATFSRWRPERAKDRPPPLLAPRDTAPGQQPAPDLIARVPSCQLGAFSLRFDGKIRRVWSIDGLVAAGE